MTHNRTLVRGTAAFLALSLSSCLAGREDFRHLNAEAPLSRAIRVDNTVYVAGHLGVDPATRRAPDDPAREIGLALDGFAKTLARTGMTMDDLVQVQVFCSDLSLYGVFNEIYKKRFESHFPTRAFIGSGPLLRGCRFEVQGIAAR